MKKGKRERNTQIYKQSAHICTHITSCLAAVVVYIVVVVLFNSSYVTKRTMFKHT